MAEQIYVSLLDEGIKVWRPVSAVAVNDEGTRFVLLRPDDYDPADETWEFPPGSVVRVEAREIPAGCMLVAVQHIALDRLSA